MEQAQGNKKDTVQTAEGNSASDAGKPFELIIRATARDGGIQTGITHSGSKPGDSREVGDLSINIAARALAFMYDAALVGNGHEDTPAGRAMFFISMQPAVMSAFMNIADSWQFRKTLSEHRNLLRKEQETKEKS